MYYNTTNETGSDLKNSKEKAISQYDRVLAYFEKHKEATPSEVLVGCGAGMLLTSVRRCISDLTADDKLIKTDKRKLGMYGKQEHVWAIYDDPEPNAITYNDVPSIDDQDDGSALFKKEKQLLLWGAEIL
tara:strand:- start:1513 stop:1902 length:390 start_codon:yes stop_codon:yes gene_type:complete